LFSDWADALQPLGGLRYAVVEARVHGLRLARGQPGHAEERAGRGGAHGVGRDDVAGLAHHGAQRGLALAADGLGHVGGDGQAVALLHDGGLAAGDGLAGREVVAVLQRGVARLAEALGEQLRDLARLLEDALAGQRGEALRVVADVSTQAPTRHVVDGAPQRVGAPAHQVRQARDLDAAGAQHVLARLGRGLGGL
jgi:hypothetical protein